MVLGIDASQANREERSGTEWYAFYLIQEFKKLLRDREDIKLRLYFRDAPREDLLNGWPPNFEVRILKWPLRYFWGQIRLSWEMFWHPPDVLFCPAHTIPIIHPSRTFTTLHDIGFVDNPELYDKLSLLYHRFSAWLAVRSAHHIFTISEFSRKRMADYYKCPENKITVTHLGVSPDFSTEKSENREKNDVGKFILFIGRLEPKKNVLGMVKAFEMAGVNCDLIFAGRRVRTKDLDDYLASRQALRDRVKFLGYIDEEQRRRLLLEAAVFLFPTFYEGFGLPILEAQAAGVPVITSNITSNPEIAGDGAVLVDPHNISEIAAAIKELLTNHELRNQKIKLGHENVKRFSWTETARLTLEKLLTSPGPRATLSENGEGRVR